MNEYLQKLYDHYESRLASKGFNRTQYLKWVKAFLEYCEGSDFKAEANFQDEDAVRSKIQEYFVKLKRQYGDGSLGTIWSILRAFFNRNHLEWPFGKGEAPSQSEDKKQHPALDPELVKEIILAVREKGSPEEQAFLALSTTYGLRRGELLALTPEEFKLKDRIIYVATLKHGRARSHLIPEEIIPYLEGYDFSQRISLSTLAILWYKIEDKAGLTHYPRVGFHSIRRTLNTVLERDFKGEEIKTFLRHKSGNDMTMAYTATKFITREGATNKLAAVLSDLDKRVFEVHPFLPAWWE
jgi:integrase